MQVKWKNTKMREVITPIDNLLTKTIIKYGMNQRHPSKYTTVMAPKMRMRKLLLHTGSKIGVQTANTTYSLSMTSVNSKYGRLIFRMISLCHYSKLMTQVKSTKCSICRQTSCVCLITSPLMRGYTIFQCTPLVVKMQL